MYSTKKNIFGKIYYFYIKDNISEDLVPTLEMYKDAVGESDIDIYLSDEKFEEQNIISQNPKTYRLYENGFSFTANKLSLKFCIIKDKPTIFAEYSKPGNARFLYSKIRSKEFSSHEDILHQLLHELILIPSTYFFDNLVPIHSASFSFNNKAFLLAGTGGVGKTSAMLALSDKEGYSFMSDDLTILTDEGKVQPNLAWPKIYGYNTTDTDLTEKILKDRNLLDKLHWHTKNNLNPSNVRRKLKPDKLYKSIETEGKKLEAIFFLFRENISEIRTDYMSVSNAIQSIISIMETEYYVLHQKLHWHKYNVINTSKNQPFIFNLEQKKLRWKNILQKVLNNESVFIIRIPFNITHKKYLEVINRIVSEAVKKQRI